MGSPDDTTVQAAGCVLWRRSPVTGELEVCLVHRPKYDDWSWPKGKLKRDEEALAGALREVAEETGCRAAPGAELPTQHYLANGRPKQVRYWAAEALTCEFSPTDEVDRVLWLTPAAARARLTQPHDRPLVDALLALPAPESGTRTCSPRKRSVT
ncbi:DNA mismatch repair protein MutT [Streptomyces violarus]|uniref:8-oxo-dGTP diphosphatase n=1 Tax=Streptomyces violarus TaxID=67380 RepID=A0A7W5F642_9ACTN|nr:MULTISPECIES: NUDIX hydrolase [Streptomyces]MBB3081154.1 8-oxo-dGTP diphosphatase [Streptomyces violarus]WRU00263.1 NUDIX hydrolase [Streptomyces sp. CGMCC 4.1772]GHD12750.1 DNA mismatch repair protein MutT [Streptomyces violarus]